MNNHPINHDDMTGQHVFAHKNCWVPPYYDNNSLDIHGHLNSLDIHGHLNSLDIDIHNTHTVDISSFGFVTNE